MLFIQNNSYQQATKKQEKNIGENIRETRNIITGQTSLSRQAKRRRHKVFIYIQGSPPRPRIGISVHPEKYLVVILRFWPFPIMIRIAWRLHESETSDVHNKDGASSEGQTSIYSDRQGVYPEENKRSFACRYNESSGIY